MSDCDAVLIQRTTISDHWEIKELCAIFSLVTQDNYAESKTTLGIKVPGYFTGDYSDFSKKRDQLYSQYSYTYSRDESRTLIQSFVPPEAYNAWIECMAPQSGLICSVSSKDAESSIVNITWRRPPGLSGLIGRKLTLSAGAGPILSDGFTGQNEFEGTAIVLVRRSKTSDITGVASGMVKAANGSTAGYPVSFVVPKQASVPPPQEWLVDAGMSNDATITIPPQPYERNVKISLFNQHQFELDGDPWHECTLFIDDKQIWYQRASTGFNNNILQTTLDRPLPANQTMKVYARTNNYRTRNRTLKLTVGAIAKTTKIAAVANPA